MCENRVLFLSHKLLNVLMKFLLYLYFEFDLFVF